MKKRWISMLLCICMVVSIFPTAAFASEEAEAAEEIIQEVVEEIVCTCGTDDAAFHAVTCGAYTAPAEPECFCAEKCAEPNEWCDICGFDYEACGGTDTAVTYEEEPCTHVDADKPKGYCDLCGELLVTAEGTSADGLHWVFREGDGTLTITGEGPMQNYESNNTPWEDFDTKIQSLVISEGVTTIGDYAFHQGEKLASVSLSSTITYIGDHTFYNCDALTSIVLPDSVTTLGARAFASCGNLTSVKLSENLTEIPESAFYPCSKLTSVVIPASVQTIGRQAFRDCKSITTITLNEGLKSIGELAFYNCDVLEAVSIPGSVTVIDEGAFNNCDALASLTLTEGLETIGDGAFRECANLTLTNENLPSTLTTLGSYAFLRTGITSVVLPDGLSVIDTHAFQECPNLKHVTLPGNLTKVDDYAFQECTALQSVIFPEDIADATIEGYVFENCTSLTSLYIPGGITKIGGYAFRGCTALRDVTILDGLQAPGSNTTYSLGSHAFGECQDLSMILPATLTKVNNYAFSDASISSAHYLGTEEALAKVDFNSDKVLSSKIHACVMAEGKAATCTEPGHSSGWMCEKCDFTMGAVETAPLGHKYSNGVCENCGEACVHTGGETTCTHRAKCTVCKESYGERNPDNHVKDTFYYRNKDENVHTVKHSCCEAVYKTEAHTYENGICTGCGKEDTDGLDLNGLNVLCLGDSITAGQGLTTDTRWTNVLASKYDWNLTNKSQGGISLTSYYYTTNGKSDVSIAKKAEVLKTMTTKPDVIIVWGGHNDTSYRYSPLGTWDDETTDSFKGALKYIAELADEYAPNATVFVLTPLWTTEVPSTLKVPENTTDNNWMFVDAIYDGAEAYGWIPINMDLCGITPFTISGLTLDSVHPNAAGTEKIVEYLSAELASYGENSKKETILFNKSDVSMKTGESTTLKAVQSPRSGTGTMTFTWSSSDSSVATVDANGKIIAVAPGNAIITVTTTNGTSAGIGVSVVCEHTYETTVTVPTCTEQGYTTYTCECGDSYVSDYVDAVGHTYKNGTCTGCGEAQPGPVITQQPESVQQEIGKKFAITVKAEGDGLTYQWYVKESGAKAFKVSSNKTASYAYAMQTYMHNRQVYCVITDANGNSVQTETATITRPPQALKILQQPQDAQQEIGQKFSIKPTVQGDGLTYQWYYKESYMKDFAVSSNKTSAYAYTMQSYMHNRSVYCVITDQYGNSVTTDAATITRPPVELKILQQPADVYAAKGDKFSIKPEVQGDGLTYQWYYKESYMKDFKPSSNKTSAYAYSMQSYMNNRSVYCVITDKFGNQVQTEAVTIYLEK